MRCSAAWLALLSGALVALDAAAAENPFDGRWSVDLVCPDTKDKGGFAKGYRYTFDVQVEHGVLHGSHGAPGHPASLVYQGTVGDDGTLEITATGNTRNSEYTVGRVAQGSAYAYTLHGKLAGSAGQATRRELRPCTATFAKSSDRKQPDAAESARSQ